MAVLTLKESSDFGDSLIDSRRIDGELGQEIFLRCTPTRGSNLFEQAAAAYSGIKAMFERYRVAPQIASETLYLEESSDLAQTILSARNKAFGNHAESLPPSSVLLIQKPLEDNTLLCIHLHAVIPGEGSEVNVRKSSVAVGSSSAEAAARGVQLLVNQHKRFFSEITYGAGDGIYDRTLSMFERAKRLLAESELQFCDVARTWIYFREMERDYHDFNRARRQFFMENQINVAPASTGIGAGLVDPDQDIGLVVYAESGEGFGGKSVMKTPTLNEAPSYGADFSRGQRVVSREYDLLLISGTASLNEVGESVHLGDPVAQADRMLLNILELLKVQGADYGNIVLATTYVKRAQDWQIIRSCMERAAFTGFPHSCVQAEVCRPELLCEAEVLAVVPR